MTNVKTSTVYQAQAGDGFRNKRMRRTNSYFNTPEEAVSEALAMKEKMDLTYKNEIEWDYDRKITGSVEKMKILKGYLVDDEGPKVFYLQISSFELQKEYRIVLPKNPQKVSSKDKKVITRVTKLYM